MSAETNDLNKGNAYIPYVPESREEEIILTGGPNLDTSAMNEASTNGMSFSEAAGEAWSSNIARALFLNLSLEAYQCALNEDPEAFTNGIRNGFYTEISTELKLRLGKVSEEEFNEARDRLLLSFTDLTGQANYVLKLKLTGNK